MPTKGKAIRFVKGTHAGETGWYNDSKRKSKRSVYRHVIVHLVDDDDKVTEKATRVKKTSIRPEWDAPQTFEQACVQQHPEMEQCMTKLAEMWAECAIQDNVGAVNVFHNELDKARKYNAKKGHFFREVNWNPDARMTH